MPAYASHAGEQDDKYQIRSGPIFQPATGISTSALSGDALQAPSIRRMQHVLPPCCFSGPPPQKRLGSVHAILNNALRLKRSLVKAPAAAMRRLARLATQAMAF